MELLSSISEETYKLWNKRDRVRCQEKQPVKELICLVLVKDGGAMKFNSFIKLTEYIDQRNSAEMAYMAPSVKFQLNPDED